MKRRWVGAEASGGFGGLLDDDAVKKFPQCSVLRSKNLLQQGIMSSPGGGGRSRLSPLDVCAK